MSYICPEIAIVMENATVGFKAIGFGVPGYPISFRYQPNFARQAFSGSTTLPSSESLSHWAKVWCLHKETEPISTWFNYVAFNDLRVQLANCLGRMYKLYTKSYKGFIFPRMLRLQQQLGWQIHREQLRCPILSTNLLYTKNCPQVIIDIHLLKCTLWLCQNSYWKWPFIVDFPIKNGDFT